MYIEFPNTMYELYFVYFFQVDSTEANFTQPIREYMLYNEAVKVNMS